MDQRQAGNNAYWFVSMIRYVTVWDGPIYRGVRDVRCLGLALISASLLLLQTFPGQAQTVSPQQRPAATNPQRTAQPLSLSAKLRVKSNRDVVTIISSDPYGGFLYTAHDIAAVLERKSKFRVIPVVGKGGAQNVKDVLYLSGIDMGIMHPHVIRHFNKTGEIGSNVDKRIAFITPLFADELHIIACPELKSFDDLRGKRVNFGELGSGTQISMRIIFKALGMQVEEVNLGQADAYEMMKRGELDATTCTCPKPLRSIRNLPKENGFKFLSVPYAAELEETFLPAVLTSVDYPNLIAQGQQVETIAVQSVLGVYNWKSTTTARYKKIAKFVRLFFDNIDEFRQPPRQPKWRSLNIAAKVKGLKRFPPAQKWLEERATAARSRQTLTSAQLPRNDNRSNSPSALNRNEQEKLFRQFLNWVQRQPDKN